jgi:hypothetical protein
MTRKKTTQPFEDNLRIVILSRGRSKTITSHRLFPGATLTCPESEVSEYEKTGLEIVPHPDAVRGLGKLRTWILKRFTEEILVMVDDDVIGVLYLGDLSPKEVRDPDYAYQVAVGAAVCAKDLGVGAFGFNQYGDVRKYLLNRPFVLNKWAGGVIGVIGRDIPFLEHHLFRVDVDFFLENLLHKRIVWIENRFCFRQARDRNLGGNSLCRTGGGIEEEFAFLKHKWGGHLDVARKKTTIETSIKVPR